MSQCLKGQLQHPPKGQKPKAKSKELVSRDVRLAPHHSAGIVQADQCLPCSAIRRAAAAPTRLRWAPSAGRGAAAAHKTGMSVLHEQQGDTHCHDSDPCKELQAAVPSVAASASATSSCSCSSSSSSWAAPSHTLPEVQSHQQDELLTGYIPGIAGKAGWKMQGACSSRALRWPLKSVRVVAIPAVPCKVPALTALIAPVQNT